MTVAAPSTDARAAVASVMHAVPSRRRQRTSTGAGADGPAAPPGASTARASGGRCASRRPRSSRCKTSSTGAPARVAAAASTDSYPSTFAVAGFTETTRPSRYVRTRSGDMRIKTPKESEGSVEIAGIVPLPNERRRALSPCGSCPPAPAGGPGLVCSGACGPGDECGCDAREPEAADSVGGGEPSGFAIPAAAGPTGPAGPAGAT